MNNKITLPELVDAIAELTNTSKRVSELFLKELFGVIKERLELGETVKIKNLGTFKVTEIAARKSVNINTGEDMEIAAHRRVSFTPDKSLAEAINTPFEGFETIALDDNITDEELEILSSTTIDDIPEITPPPFNIIEESDNIETVAIENPTPTTEEVITEEPEPASVTIVEDNTTVQATAETTSKPEQVEEVEEISIIEQNETIEPELQAQDDDCNDSNEQPIVPQDDKANEVVVNKAITTPFVDDEEEIKYDEEELDGEKRKSFIWGAALGLAIGAVVAIIAWFFMFRYNETSVPQTESVITHSTEQTDSISKDKPEEPLYTATIHSESESMNDKPSEIVDTVKTNYFLTKMSRKYYGRYEFWVYIYEENKSKIKNPNSVSPGLVVVIPPAEKYGINKDDPESVRKAKELAEKIL